MTLALIGLTGLLLSIFAAPFSFLLTCLAGSAIFARRQPRSAAKGDEHSLLHLTVIVPAHNEESSIQLTVEAIRGCSYPVDKLRLLVIADNCTDDTAAIAAAAGAEVYRRHNTEKRGKGHALEEVMGHLISQSSEYYRCTDGLIIIDADAIPDSGFFNTVSQAVANGADFGQCLNIVRNDEDTWRTQLLSYAFILFNGVYLLGFTKLGLSGHLRGNGIFFSISGAKRHPWKAASLAEDLEFSWKLKLSGEHIHFLQKAVVRSDMPTDSKTSKSQRSRWEHGRGGLKSAMTIPLLRSGLPYYKKAIMLLDLWLPALSTLVASAAGGFAAITLSIMLDPNLTAWKPVYVIALLNIIGLTIYLASPFLAGFLPVRKILSLRYAPFYAAWRLLTVLAPKPQSWIRTTRVKSSADQPKRALSAKTLINLGDYYGSLAAARCLGDYGLPVAFADHRQVVPGPWSRFVVERLNSPNPWVESWQTTSQWIKDLGRKNPGMFLYPTCDDLCYLLSRDREELGEYYLLYQPDVTTIMTLLDKKKLALAAAEVGLQTPLTFTPESIGEIRTLAGHITDRMLIKPRTQVGLLTRGKGQLCDDTASLVERVQAFRTTETYRSEILEYDQGLSWPLIQKYSSTAVDGMISIAGFVPHDGSNAEVLGSRKIFQRPRRLGVGIAFVAEAPDPGLVDGLLRLCKRVGYYGIFEAEFVTDEMTGAHMLIDFNPRYYGQMAFEIARGLRLPVLAYAAARKQASSSPSLPLFEPAAFRTEQRINLLTRPSEKYALGWNLKFMLVTQLVGGKLSLAEFRGWRRWLCQEKAHRSDAVFRRDDLLPWVIEIMMHSIRSMRHPRDTFRKFFG